MVTEQIYRTHGLNHFCIKYGFPYSDDLERFKNNFSIELVENEIQSQIVTWIKTDYGKVPIFEGLKDDTLIKEEDNKLRINFDIFNEIGHILSGHIEKLTPEEKTKIAKIPFVDIYEQILFDAISKNRKVKTKPFWPDGKKFALCLTHDVDEIKKTYQYFTRSIQHIRRLEFSRAFHHIKSFFTDKILGNNPYWTFEEIMELEDELGVRSTFFFLQEDARVELSKPETWRHYARRYKFNDLKVIKLINKLSSGGWEIGLHGSFYSYNNKKKLTREKKDLEEALGGRIHGIRQHNLNLKIPETWQYQEEIGLEYDTTLGPKGNIGFRWGTSFPFYPLNPENGRPVSILEVPLSIMDIHLFRNKKNAWNEFLEVLKMVEKHNGLLTVLFHHTVFNDREYPGWSDMYKKIINLCKEKGAWITTASEINKWWRSR